MEKLVSVITGVGKTRLRYDDDFVDRLNHRYTTSVLVVFAIFVSTTAYVGDPIHCWVPAHFTGGHEAYANNICWVTNTFHLPFADNVPKAGEPVTTITYYQWVPFILLFQALLYFFPCALWRGLNTKSGMDVDNVVTTALKYQHADQTADREKNMNYMTKQIDRYVARRKRQSNWFLSVKLLLTRTCCFLCGQQKGNYLAVLYTVIKLLYIVNSLGQIFALNLFLGAGYDMYGIDVVRRLAAGQNLTDSPRFPKVTSCNFDARRIGNIHRYTVQCVLPINLFNEKIFVFVWFWLVFVALVTCLNFAAWTVKFSFRVDRIKYVRKHLNYAHRLGMERPAEKQRAVRFTEQYLRQDGVFIIRLVAHNTNGVVVSDLVNSLWDHYRSSPMMDMPVTDTLLDDPSSEKQPIGGL